MLTILYFLSNIIISLIVTVNIFRTVEMKSPRIQIALPSFFTKETNNAFVRIIPKWKKFFKEERLQSAGNVSNQRRTQSSIVL